MDSFSFSQKKRFFYKLGHCRELAETEYSFLSGDQNYLVDKDWLLGSEFIHVNLTGSLVFGGTILGLVDLTNDFSKVLTLLQENLILLKEFKPDIKKLGLYLPKIYQLEGLRLAKQIGFRKINLAQQLPNFGSWKSLKQWFLVVPLDRYWLVGKIDNYANQEFWSVLDLDLPHKNLKSGIINLKLARSLLNLTKKSVVWDPFCGQGRLIVSGLDLKQKFLASDIATNCVLETQSNYLQAKSIWSKYWKHFQLNGNFLPASLVTEVLDARILSKSKNFYTFSNLAIVTEGYLGTNFTQPPSLENIRIEFQKLFDLWNQVIAQASQLKIPELIFCLPVYLRSKESKQKVWPQFQDFLVKKTNYRLCYLHNRKLGILYSRPKSLVGHWIVKLIQT